MWTVLAVVMAAATVCRAAEIGSYDFDNKIEESGPNNRDNLTSNVYILPEQIFNDGKPFFVKKDASGSIDFNAKTTPESLPVPTDAVSTQTTATNDAVNSTRKHDINLDNSVRTQNIHDFLNLPVKYQSSKFVYPLVSSSYANLKYQGNNKNYISNHKLDSSTIKSVAYTTKKYKSTYPPKSYSTSYTSRTTTTTEAYESSPKVTQSTPTAATTNSTRKYSNIPSRGPATSRAPTPTRGSTPGRRYTTLSRVSTTTVRNSLPNVDAKFTRGRTTTTTTPASVVSSEKDTLPDLSSTVISLVGNAEKKPIATTQEPEDEKEQEGDSMNIGDFFSYFFNNEESTDKVNTKATPSTTVMTLRPTVSSTQAPFNKNENTKTHSSRYNVTLDSATRKPINRTAPELSTSTARPIDHVAFASTVSPVVAEYGNKNVILDTGKFRPPTTVNNIRVSPGAQTATFVTNGQVSAGFGVHPFNEQKLPQNVVLAETNESTRFDQKPVTIDSVQRPVVNAIDETTKPGITFISKGHVTSAEAYDHPSQNKVVFHAPAANSNNIVIAPGTHTATFVTSSQMSMGSSGEQPVKNVENEINIFGAGLQSTQKPHGFQLPTTTSLPKPVNTAANETQHVRFPSENAEITEADAASNNTIKFPTNQVPQAVQQMPQTPVSEGLVRFGTNEIIDTIDPNTYNQMIQTPNMVSLPGSNFVVFRQQPPIAIQQTPLVMSLNMPPQMIRSPFVFKKPAFVHYPSRKNYTLPNILPQFRPTQPQQQISISPEMANQLRQGQLNRAQYLYNAQNLRYKTQMPMQYMFSPRPMVRPSIEMQNRRHFELHPGNFNQRIYDRPVLPHVYNRNAIGANALLVEPQRFEENMKVAATNGNLDASKNVDFENGDGKLIAAQPIVESHKDIPKVEPVTTLQMIQQQRLLQKTGAGAGLSGNRNGTADANGDKPLYVVYPMQKTAAAAPTRGNGEIATILAEQMHKPATIQQLGLPYTLEKSKSRYILNSRPAYEFEKKSEQQQDPIAAENDEEDR